MNNNKGWWWWWWCLLRSTETGYCSCWSCGRKEFSLLRTGGNSNWRGASLFWLCIARRTDRPTSSRVPDSTPLLRGPPSQSLSWAALNCSRAVGGRFLRIGDWQGVMQAEVMGRTKKINRDMVPANLNPHHSLSTSIQTCTYQSAILSCIAKPVK